MLRLGLILAAAAVLVTTLAVSLLAGVRALWPAVFWSALILAGLLCERFVYKPVRRRAPGPGWVATGERFRDPKTLQEIQVFFRPGDGKRMYVSVDAVGDHTP